MNEIFAAEAAPAISAMHAWGLAVIHAFQTVACPALTLLAQAITFLGGPWTYLAVIPLVFWCIDERRGARLGLAVLLSNGIVDALKVNLAVPRPGRLDPSVELVTPPDAWSTPSGHSSRSAVLWPIAMLDRSRRGAKKGSLALRLGIAIGVPLLVGLSRVYLGVHYPTDVLSGWAIGAAFSVAVILGLPALTSPSAENPVARAWRALSASRESTGRSFRSFKLALAAAAAFALNAANPGDSSMGGAVFGFAAGYILLTDTRSPDEGESAQQWFSARAGSVPRKALRLALGLAALVILYVGLKRVMPGVSSPYYSLCRFIRYGILGFWITLGAPIAFVKLGLGGNPAGNEGDAHGPHDAGKAQ